METDFSYLSPRFRPGVVRVFAHRGLAESESAGLADENTMPAFLKALEAGADYIESDIQVTADGIPVLFHDDDLSRVANRPEKISQLTWAELSQISMAMGAFVPTLEQALLDLPAARFNLDFKVAAAIVPATDVINRLGAQQRVLVASFSEGRRKQAVGRLVGSVVSSAGGMRVIALYLAHVLRANWLWSLLSKPIDALQLPVKAGVFNFASRSFIDLAHRHRVEIHFWTINEPEQMHQLIAMGADGLVTDRADIARAVCDSLA